jgi:hypothetical protein
MSICMQSKAVRNMRLFALSAACSLLGFVASNANGQCCGNLALDGINVALYFPYAVLSTSVTQIIVLFSNIVPAWNQEFPLLAGMIYELSSPILVCLIWYGAAHATLCICLRCRTKNHIFPKLLRSVFKK